MYGGLPGWCYWERDPACQGSRHETWVRSLSQEDSLEEDTATHSSILAWKSPWTQEPGRLQSIGLQRVRQDCLTGHTCLDTCICITESLCCTSETNTTLVINYTPISNKSAPFCNSPHCLWSS